MRKHGDEPAARNGTHRGIQRAALVGFIFVLMTTLGCSAVYPEMQTAVRALPPGAAVEPAPADDLHFVYFDGAWIPPKDKGGLPWPGGAPDPYAKLIVNDVDLIVTPVQSRSREPTWPNQEKENHRIYSESKVFIELWDKNPVTDLPICRVRVLDIAGSRMQAVQEYWCDSGARVRLHVGPAKALVGIGLYYETRGREGVRVTRVIDNSPAARAGLGTGDRILAINGKKVDQMDALQVRNEINLHARTSLELDVWFKSGKRHLVTLKEGALFPVSGDNVKVTR